MSFFEKMRFWKKKEDDFSNVGLNLNKDFSAPDFGLGKSDDITSGYDPSLNSAPSGFQQPGSQQQFQSPPQYSPPNQFGQQNFSAPQSTFAPQPAFSQASQPYYQQQSSPQYTVSKEIEIISIKLDAIRSSLESINQRIAGLERVAYGESEQPKRKW